VRFCLGAYLDDEVSAAVRAEVDAHLVACPGCRRAVARLHRLAGLLADTAAPPVPEGLAGHLVARARRPAAARVTGVARWWEAAALLRHVAAVFVCAAGLAAGAWLAWGAASAPAVATREPAAAPADPVAAYNLDYLGGQPKESLPQVYLTLVSATDRPGEPAPRRP
jgi:anti-sigma factor RsiW